jgi:hypothetical protein
MNKEKLETMLKEYGTDVFCKVMADTLASMTSQIFALNMVIKTNEGKKEASNG